MSPTKQQHARAARASSTREVTRQLQACIHKAEEDEHRIKECLATERRLTQERETAIAKLQVPQKSPAGAAKEPC